MAMDFFAAQDAARGRTRKLIALFIAAVIGLIVTLYVAVMGLWFAGSASDGVSATTSAAVQAPQGWWNPQVFAAVAGLTVLVVGLSSWGKIIALRAGGGAVARSMGGRRLAPDTTDPDERKLLNVVEEMSIASGVSVPEVYVMDNETGINAFAAGFTLDDAAVAVTRGCMEQLSRDELQGVIAHEFSHILNGDMRLNVRLIGILFGILVLAVVGRTLMRVAFFSGGSRRSSKEGGGAAAIGILGLVLLLVGYLGVFFGRMIQSAVSRQREFLADSAAVQFTRNPSGLTGALRKIGSGGSQVRNEHGVDAAHMFFASGFKMSFGGMFATHPPLKNRILAIDPSWDGSFTETQVTPSRKPKSKPRPPAEASAPAAFSPQAMVGMVGMIGAAQLAHAGKLRESLDRRFGEATHQPLQARALVFALLVDDTVKELRETQIRYLESDAGPELAEAIRVWHARLGNLQPGERLPLVEMALPALHALSDERRHDFIRRMEWIIQADARVTLFDFAVTWMARSQLQSKDLKDRTPKPPVADPKALAEPVSMLIASLVLLESADSEAETRFDQAFADSTSFAGLARFPGVQGTSFKDLDQALQRMATATFALRKEILETAYRAVLSDGKVSVEESELMRVIAAALHCPMPPMVPDLAT